MIINDIKEGSRLWKLFRGINQRKEPVRQLFGGETSFIRYDGESFALVDNIADAVIVQGANLQSAAFWRRLQTEIKTLRQTPVWIKHPGGAGYNGQQSLELVTATEKTFRAYAGNLAIRSTDDTVAHDDILGSWLFDDMEAMLAEMFAVQIFLAATPTLTKNTGSGERDTYSAAVNGARSNYNFSQPAISASFYGTVELLMDFNVKSFVQFGRQRYVANTSSEYTPQDAVIQSPYSSFDIQAELVYYQSEFPSRTFIPLNPNYSAPGLYTVGSRIDGPTITIPFSSLGVAYSGQFPPDLLGSNTFNSSFAATIIPVIHCQFADLT